MERSLLLIKPDAVQHQKPIVALLESRGFFILKAEETHFTRERAVEYYLESTADPEYGNRVSFLSSGPSYAIVVSKVRAVVELRALAGPLDPEEARKTQPNSLRALYGTDALKNAVGVSVSADVALREIASVFPSPPLHVLPSESYLRETVLPGLVEAMSTLCSPGNIPTDPFAAMERWLLMNRPMTEGVYDHPVLGDHVLKQDKLDDKLLSGQMIPGVANFRKVKGPAPIYAMAQCPMSSHDALVAHLAEAGHSNITFVNVREEPVVYIKGQSCTIRNPHDLYKHVVHLSNVEAHELVRVERRLQRDIEAFAYRHKGRIPMFDGNDQEISVENITTGDIIPLSEMYSQLQGRHPNVNFVRIPTTAGSIPADDDVVALVDVVRTLSAGSCLVIECSSGAGRATLMEAMALCIWRILHATPSELNLWMTRSDNISNEGLRRATSLAELKKEGSSGAEDHRKSGDFKVVRQLLGTIGYGTTMKSFVDGCVDMTDDVVNLRNCIADYLDEREHAESNNSNSVGAVKNAARFLRSYCRLLVLGAYAVESSPDFSTNFKDWHRQHWNLQRPLKHLSFE